jgi:hypothetical protein
MAQRLSEIAFAAGVVLLVYLTLFSRVALQSSSRMIVFLLPVVLNVVGWRRWNSVSHDGSTARWRKTVGLLALGASTLSVALACVGCGVFAYALVRFVNTVDHPPVPWLNAIEAGLFAQICLALSAVAVLGSFMAPARIRLAVALSGLTMACLIASIR